MKKFLKVMSISMLLVVLFNSIGSLVVYAESYISYISVSGIKQSALAPDEQDTLDVTLTLENNGSTAIQRMIVSLEGYSYDSFMPVDDFGPLITSIGARETTDINFKLYVSPHLVGGRFPLTLKIISSDSFGYTDTIYRNVAIHIDRELNVIGRVTSSLSKPRILLTNVDYGSTFVVAGDEVVLKYTLKNISKEVLTKNILVSFTSDRDIFMPSFGSTNQDYIPEIPPEGTYNGMFRLRSRPESINDLYTAIFTVEYEDPLNSVYRTQEAISIMVTQEQLLIVDDIPAPDSLRVNHPHNFSIRYKNSSRRPMEGLTMTVVGNVRENGTVIQLDNLKAGGSGLIDQLITPISTGTQEISFIFSVENAYEQISTEITKDVILTVEEVVSEQPPTGQTTSPNNLPSNRVIINSRMMIYIIIGISIVAVIVVIVVVYFVKKNKNK